MPEVERGIRRSLRRNALVARGLVFLDAITQGPISDEELRMVAPIGHLK